MDKQKGLAIGKSGVRILFWLGFMVFFVYSFKTIVDLSAFTKPHRLEVFSRIVSALSKPRFEEETRLLVTEKMWETIQIAFLATTISAGIAIPFTLLSARPSSSLGRGFNVLLQPVLSAIRSIHPLFFSILTVTVVGLGPAASVLALTFFSTAVLIGTFSEYAQQYPTLSWPVLLKVRFPGLALKQLPANTLTATVLGFVGGGGIGFALQQSVYLLDYRAASVGFLACIIVIGSMDLVARAVWRKIQTGAFALPSNPGDANRN